MITAEIDWVEGLYRNYADDLRKVRKEQVDFYLERGELSSRHAPLPTRLLAATNRIKTYLSRGTLLKPQLDDLEAEITYLRIRELKPDTVVEISPCGGWSTTWILRALRDNKKGHLYSYDLVDHSKRNVPPALAENRWFFHLGNVIENDKTLPQKIDYLFIDSDHSAEFAKWYISKLLAHLHKGTAVSVHDVFHTNLANGFDNEGGVIMDWIQQNAIPYFTASGAKAPQNEAALLKLKTELEMKDPIHRAKNNSMIFFEI